MRHSNRKGQALVEFALVSLACVLGVCGLVGIGIMLLHAGIVNNIGGSCRDLLFERITSRPMTSDDENEMRMYVYQELETQNLYNENHLSLSPEDFRNGTYEGGPLASINKLMLPLYQYDRDYDVYRYPGTIVIRVPVLPGQPRGNSILVPRLSPTGAAPRITQWYQPLEINDFSPKGAGVIPTSFALTINFPSQSAVMHEHTHALEDIDENFISWVPANDSESSDASLPNGYSFNSTVVQPVDEDLALNRGKYGLGSSPTYATQIRPFRKVFYSTVIVRLKP